MNYWTEQSVIFANQKNYLDELFKVYPSRNIPWWKMGYVWYNK